MSLIGFSISQFLSFVSERHHLLIKYTFYWISDVNKSVISIE